ncbi:MAG: hypothetical protein M8467_14015, partial [Anaerolineae bacterium]|nr:hypothetical protein [Anaerolineae bacterium]
EATPSPSASQVIALGTETPAGGEVTPSLAPATSEEPTATSTASPPATPSEEPTATSEPATDTPLAPTDTPSPTPTHTPTPTTPPPPITCSFDAQGTFAGLWNTYKEQLGCPAYAEPKAIQDAEQALENGRMFWRQDNERIYVVYEQGSRSGTYQDYADLWSEGDPEYSCSATPPPGLVQPIRGFGAIWCDLGAASAPIGWGLSEEAGFWPGNGDPLVQDFEHGVIFRDSDGTTQGLAYVLFRDTGEFERVAY